MKSARIKRSAKLVLWGVFLFSLVFLLLLTWDIAHSQIVEGSVVEVLEVRGMRGVSYHPIVTFHYNGAVLVVKTVMSSSWYDYENGASVRGLYTENGKGRLYLWIEVVLAYLFLVGLGCVLPMYMLKR